MPDIHVLVLLLVLLWPCSRDACFLASTIMSYTCGAALFRYLTIRHEQSKRPGRSRFFGKVLLMIFSMFVTADLVGLVLPIAERWLAMFLGLGFGFINAVSVDETSVITWAATGHMNKIGKAVVDSLVTREKLNLNNPNLRTVGIFMGSIVVSAVLYQQSSLWTLISRFLPSVGMAMGICYTALFGCYGLQLARREDKTKMMNIDLPQSSSYWDPLFLWSPFKRNENDAKGIPTTR